MSETQISLRSKRKPGYSWVDNEISTCYQRIVGPDATWVYHNLAQQVQEQDREPSVTFALRDMAAWTGRSKDTVQRALAVLELVGLIAVQRGAKAKARYDLMDVKELVLSHGGVYDVRRSSFVLPDTSFASLKVAVEDLRKRMGRKPIPSLVSLPALIELEAVNSESVALSDRLPVDNLFLSVPQSDRIAAQEDTSVAPGPVASSYRKEVRSKKKTNPLTPASQGNCATKENTDASQTKSAAALEVESHPVQRIEDHAGMAGLVHGKQIDQELQGTAIVTTGPDRFASSVEQMMQGCGIEAAIDQVMIGCGFNLDRRRLRKALRGQLQQKHDVGVPYATTALVMKAAWKKYILLGDLISAPRGPERFFGEGIWRDERGWKFDRAALEERRQLAHAGIGSNRN